jgi:Rrf2 family protein
MANVLRISEAASLALHTMVLLARKPEERLSTKEIAGVLEVSEAHLSKVLQRLGRVGLVNATRGPSGGFVVRENPDGITLLEVYEAIEGPLNSSKCLLGTPICNGGGKCILGGLLEEVNKEVKDYLSGTTISELTDVYGREGTDAPEDNKD